jgi:hypothetical protein
MTKNIERDRKIAFDARVMAKVVIVCWQDVPSLVEVREGASVGKKQLSARFQELIDIVAMRKKLTGSDAYLEQWNRRKDGERAGNVNDVAAAVAAEIESRFEEIRAAAIAQIKES